MLYMRPPDRRHCGAACRRCKLRYATQQQTARRPEQPQTRTNAEILLHWSAQVPQMHFYYNSTFSDKILLCIKFNL